MPIYCSIAIIYLVFAAVIAGIAQLYKRKENNYGIN